MGTCFYRSSEDFYLYIGLHIFPGQRCNVWDLDENKFIDMSIMGIGTNILGYGRPEVDEAVQETIKKGNMSTLNCPEEVYWLKD